MLSKLLGNPWVLSALALLIVGMGGTIQYYRASAIGAEAKAARVIVERDTALAVNVQKDKEIARLVKQAAINNDIMIDLHKEMQALNAAADATSQALTDLGNSNEGIKVFLDTPYPVELQRLLNQR